MPLVQQLNDKYIDRGLVVVTIHSGGSPAGVARLLAGKNYTFTTLLDPQNDTGRAYRLQYVPTTFFIDREGFIRDKVIGGFENLAQIEDRIKKILP
jgi:cytochrome c biogenesis protein CcmG/thiol:disulfide interchange protein DsbE